MSALTPQELRFAASGGLTLAAEAWGEESDPPVLLLHGGGQTRGAWGASGPRLAERGWRAIAVDMRGHGESDWSRDADYTVEAYALDVQALAEPLDQTPAVVGASLGGMCSLLAIGELDLNVRGLVLVDVAHRTEVNGVERIMEFMTSAPDGFATLDEAADAVADYLPHRERRADTNGLEKNLRQRNGRWVWHWDPQMVAYFSERVPELRKRDPERLERAAKMADLPMLLVRGGLSDIVSPEIAAEFRELVPQAEFAEVGSAAHMVAGDRNDRFLDALIPFLDRL